MSEYPTDVLVDARKAVGADLGGDHSIPESGKYDAWPSIQAAARAIVAERAKTVAILTECYDLLESAPLESEVKLSGILPRIAAIIGKGAA